MSLYNTICEKTMKLSDVFLKMKMYENFTFLMSSQWWSESKINDYQNTQLKLLIENAYENVPYYNELFKSLKLKPSDIKTKEDLNKLPLLTKEDIQKNFPKKLTNRNLKKEKLILGASSGSTGRPVHYYKTKDSHSMIRAANLRGWYWTGFRLGDPYLKIATMQRDSRTKKIQDFLNRSKYIKYESLSPNVLSYIVKTIIKKGYRTIRGTPSTLYVLAKFIEKEKYPTIKLDTIITTSEPLFPILRKTIESVFCCKIYDSYGAEGAPLIFECSTHECYHVSQEISIVEFGDLKDRQNNEKKKMIVTDLTNFATPLIRYDINDIVIPFEGKCSCGRKMKSITSIEGRDSDILITPQGNYMTFNFFAGYFKHKLYIELFQLKQITREQFVLSFVPNESYHPSQIDPLYKELLGILGKGVDLSIQVVDDIPLTVSGKRRFLVRDKNIDICV